jgi:hypothetical protein
MKNTFPVFCSYKCNGFYWFRIKGYGVAFKNIKVQSLLFSERNRYTKYILIGNWLIKILHPNIMSFGSFPKIRK